MLPYSMGIMERGVRGLFAREFLTKQKKVKYTNFTTVVDSDKQEEKYSMISTLPQLSLLKDERILAGFSEYSYKIMNQVYATGIRVPRTLFEYDQTGQLRTLVQSLGARVANFPDKLIAVLLGANTTCFDSGAMFSVTHDLGNGVSQINLITGNMTNALINNSGSTSKDNRDNCIAAAQMDLIAAKNAILAWKDDRGEPWHDDAEAEGLIIVCHPAAELFLRTIIEATVIQNTGNISVKSVGRIITINRDDPFLYSDGTVHKGTWYLMKTDTPVQPFIFQRFGAKKDFPDAIPEADQEVLKALSAVEIQSVMRTGQNISEFTFFNDEFLFGARTQYSVGNGMPMNVVKIEAAS